MDGHEDQNEIVGRGSMSRLWRVGDTVRRERGPHSAAVAALLHHLEARGYPYSPRHLGVDDQDRDILSAVPGRPVPTLRGDTQLQQVGHAVAGFIAAVADFDPTGLAWRNPEGWPRHGDRVIHNDIAPWNMLETDDGVLSGLVDFDSARPGRPVEDVAYAAWHLTPLHDEPMGDGAPPPPLGDRPRRLRVFADACGLDDTGRGRLLDEVARVQVTQGARVAAGALGDRQATARHWDQGRFTRNIARSLLWLDHHRDHLAPALR